MDHGDLQRERQMGEDMFQSRMKGGEERILERLPGLPSRQVRGCMSYSVMGEQLEEELVLWAESCVLSHVRLVVTPQTTAPPGSSLHSISQARILEWVAIPFSRGSS